MGSGTCKEGLRMQPDTGSANRSGLYRQFVKISRYRIKHHYLAKLMASLDALDDEAIWEKPSDACNSIGGTVLHILEQLRRKIDAFSSEEALHEGSSKGIEDCFPQETTPKTELMAQVTELFDQFDSVLARIHESPDPEQEDPLGMPVLYHVVEHTSYHLGQIILMAELRTGKRFDFVRNGINEAQLRRFLQNGPTE
jgi:uncharacterized damage-inducible protein DinB